MAVTTLVCAKMLAPALWKVARAALRALRILRSAKLKKESVEMASPAVGATVPSRRIFDLLGEAAAAAELVSLSSAPGPPRPSFRLRLRCVTLASCLHSWK